MNKQHLNLIELSTFTTVWKAATEILQILCPFGLGSTHKLALAVNICANPSHLHYFGHILGHEDFLLLPQHTFKLHCSFPVKKVLLQSRSKQTALLHISEVSTCPQQKIMSRKSCTHNSKYAVSFQ